MALITPATSKGGGKGSIVVGARDTVAETLEKRKARAGKQLPPIPNPSTLKIRVF